MISPLLMKKGKIESDYLGEEIIDLLSQTFTIQKDFKFNVFHVTSEYIARPDLISLDAYGDTMFADVICKINGVSNPYELNEDQYLILPEPGYIMDFTQDYKVNEKSTNENTNVPTPKSKNSKRKANEAIVGDTRFKFDPNLGIVIY